LAAAIGLAAARKLDPKSAKFYLWEEYEPQAWPCPWPAYGFFMDLL
jgi:hypothetical protein